MGLAKRVLITSTIIGTLTLTLPHLLHKSICSSYLNNVLIPITKELDAGRILNVRIKDFPNKSISKNYECIYEKLLKETKGKYYFIKSLDKKEYQLISFKDFI